MATATNLSPIDKLKGAHDYSVLKFSMQLYLEDEDLWICIMGNQQAVATGNRKKKNMNKEKLSSFLL